MAIDIKARQGITQIKSQLGDHPGGAVIGRRSSYEVQVRDTTRVSTRDTSPDFPYNTDRSKYGTATYATSFTNGMVVGRVVSGDDEFWLGSEHTLEQFTDTALSTATITNSTNSIVFVSGASSSDWFDNDWSNRVKLTIQNSQVGSVLTNFPSYVDLSDLPSGFWTTVKSAGEDIRATAADGTTQLPFEVVSVNTSSSAGEVHVKVSSVASSVDTEFYLYYGNAGASALASSATYGRNNVWTGYESVWHLQEDPTGGAPQGVDSTGNSHDLTSVNMEASDDVAAKIEKGWIFLTNDKAETGSSADLAFTNAFSIQMWFKPTSTSQINKYIIEKQTNEWALLYEFVNNKIEFFASGYTGDNPRTPMISTITDTNWHKIDWTYDGTNLKGYLEGSEDVTSAKNFTLASTNSKVTLGASGTSNEVDATIDEVRLSSTAHSADWLSAEHTNQDTPSTFYNVGSVETLSVSTSSDYVSEAIFLDSQRSFTSVFLIAPEIRTGTGVDTSMVTYQVSPDQSTWQTITPKIITTLTTSTSSLYVKMVGSSSTDSSTNFHSGTGEGTPLKIKLYEG